MAPGCRPVQPAAPLQACRQSAKPARQKSSQGARMSQEIDARLKQLGIDLPTPAPPAANYVPTVQTGKLLFVSGQIPSTADGPKYVGKVGREFTVEEGRAAARLCAVNVLAAIRAALGSLDRVARVVKLV